MLIEDRYFAFSLLTHLLIFILFSLHVSHNHLSSRVGNAQSTQVIQSYLEADQTRRNSFQEKSNHLFKQKADVFIRDHHVESLSSKATRSLTQIEGSHADKWVMMLHQQIMAKQHYPLGAKQLRREGSVTIQFDLLANGEVQNSQVIASSDNASLDEAALESVQRAAPFRGADQAQQGKIKTYQIRIVFKLTRF